MMNNRLIILREALTLPKMNILNKNIKITTKIIFVNILYSVIGKQTLTLISRIITIYVISLFQIYYFSDNIYIFQENIIIVSIIVQ